MEQETLDVIAERGERLNGTPLQDTPRLAAGLFTII
jgi:hypothetical protein